ncbi:MAG: hypothetical protein MUP76_09180, partial [Acidimicrobiia bacterium]|nr:hypothetical protein [Acidimicrobiia bacterium]
MKQIDAQNAINAVFGLDHSFISYQGTCDPGAGDTNRVVLQDPAVIDANDIVIVALDTQVRFWIYKAGDPPCPTH